MFYHLTVTEQLHKQTHGIVMFTSPLSLEFFSSSTIYNSHFVDWTLLLPCGLS